MTTRQSQSRAQKNITFNTNNAPTQFGYKVTDTALKSSKKDGLTAFKSLTQKYARKYCLGASKKKFVFLTKAEANDFIARYKADMLATNGYAPKRCYWCPDCQGYHTTSQAQATYVRHPASSAALTSIRDGNFQQHLKSVHRTLNRIDLLIRRTNKALAEHRLGDAHALCVECLTLFDMLREQPGASARRGILMDKLNECVCNWSAEDAKLQNALFRVTYNPPKLLTKQWYMLEPAA